MALDPSARVGMEVASLDGNAMMRPVRNGWRSRPGGAPGTHSAHPVPANRRGPAASSGSRPSSLPPCRPEPMDRVPFCTSRRYLRTMTVDPRAALDRLIAALEAHFHAVTTRRAEDDPAVDDAYDVLADAFEVYDDALAGVHGETLPFGLLDDDSDDDEDDVDEDNLDEDDLDDDIEDLIDEADAADAADEADADEADADEAR